MGGVEVGAEEVAPQGHKRIGLNPQRRK